MIGVTDYCKKLLTVRRLIDESIGKLQKLRKTISARLEEFHGGTDDFMLYYGNDYVTYYHYIGECSEGGYSYYTFMRCEYCKRHETFRNVKDIVLLGLKDLIALKASNKHKICKPSDWHFAVNNLYMVVSPILFYAIEDDKNNKKPLLKKLFSQIGKPKWTQVFETEEQDAQLLQYISGFTESVRQNTCMPLQIKWNKGKDNLFIIEIYSPKKIKPIKSANIYIQITREHE